MGNSEICLQSMDPQLSHPQQINTDLDQYLRTILP